MCMHLAQGSTVRTPCQSPGIKRRPLTSYRLHWLSTSGKRSCANKKSSCRPSCATATQHTAATPAQPERQQSPAESQETDFVVIGSGIGGGLIARRSETVLLITAENVGSDVLKHAREACHAAHLQAYAARLYWHAMGLKSLSVSHTTFWEVLHTALRSRVIILMLGLRSLPGCLVRIVLATGVFQAAQPASAHILTFHRHQSCIISPSHGNHPIMYQTGSHNITQTNHTVCRRPYSMQVYLLDICI